MYWMTSDSFDALLESIITAPNVKRHRNKAPDAALRAQTYVFDKGYAITTVAYQNPLARALTSVTRFKSIWQGNWNQSKKEK